jgi:hypothetical protein
MNDPTHDSSALTRRAALGMTLAASVAGLAAAVAAPAQAAAPSGAPECLADLGIGG